MRIETFVFLNQLLRITEKCVSNKISHNLYIQLLAKDGKNPFLQNSRFSHLYFFLARSLIVSSPSQG